MLDKERSRHIMALTTPILGGMLSQNILNLVDAAMVGQLGSAALGGVGIASFVNFLAMSLFIGLATGVQALVGRTMGAGKADRAAFPLNAGILLDLAIGLPLAALLVWQAPNIMNALLDDPAVVAESTPYLQSRMAVISAMGINFAFRGFWSAVGKPGVYLRTLVVMHLLNIVLNYVLIFGHWGFPALGTFGAGLGTAIAMAIGTLSYTFIAWRKAAHHGFLRGLPSRESIMSLVRIAGPAALQQFFFAAGFTALFWIIAQIGTEELAGANAIVNLTLVAILPCIAFGITANTLVSHSLGAGEPEEAYRWGWDIVRLAVAVVFLIGLPFLLFPHAILSVFLHEPAALDKAVIPLRIMGGGIAIDAVAIVLINALQGAGAARQTMLVSLSMQWGIFLPLAYLLGPVLGYGLTAIWVAQVCYRLVQMVWVVRLWTRREWQALVVATS